MSVAILLSALFFCHAIGWLNKVPTQQDYAHLVATINRSRDGYVNPLLEYKHGARGTGLFATQPLPRGTTLVTVPRQLMYRFSDVERAVKRLAYYSKTGLLLQPRGDDVTPHGDQSLWALGIALRAHEPINVMLPGECLNGVTFAANVMRDRRLVPAYMAELYEWSRQLPLHDYAALQRVAADVLGNVTLREFRKAYCFVHSRAFFDRAELAESSMVPFGDLINHDPFYESVMWDVNATGFRYYLTAPVAQGDEVLVTYHTHKENLQMLFYYGFADRNSECEFVFLPVRVDEHEQLDHIKGTTQGRETELIVDLSPRLDWLLYKRANETTAAIRRACEHTIAEERGFFERLSEPTAHANEQRTRDAIAGYFALRIELFGVLCATLLERAHQTPLQVPLYADKYQVSNDTIFDTHAVKELLDFVRT